MGVKKMYCDIEGCSDAVWKNGKCVYHNRRYAELKLKSPPKKPVKIRTLKLVEK